MKRKNKILLMIFFISLAMISYVYLKNRSYILTLKSIASEGITAGNYEKLAEIVKKLPVTKKVFSVENYQSLYANDKVTKISKTGDKVSVSLNFKDTENDIEKRSAIISFNFEPEIDLSNKILFTSVEIRGAIIGRGHQKSRMLMEVRDIHGKALRGPHPAVSNEASKIPLVLRPTTTEPIPLGSIDDNFDITKVKTITIRFVIGRYPDGVSSFPASGKLYLEDIYALSNADVISKLFKEPDARRVTQDNINPNYQLRKLKWRAEGNNFFIGIDYPWNNYGWDAGKNPYGQPEKAGWSANREKLVTDFKLFKESGITVVRIYLFFDLRTGLEYRDNKLYGFDKYVWPDIETIFSAAGETGIKIIPVLFDFSIADGQGSESKVGEHSELIFSSEKQDFLIYSMIPTLRAMDEWNKKYGEPVFAVELMNEPENMAMLLVPGYFQALKNWFKDLANIIHNETSFKVTLGSSNLVDMQKWWNDVDIDIRQFHFYKYMTLEHERYPLNLKRDKINLPGLIFCGELEPYNIAENIETIKNNGYGGILFWSWNSTDGFGVKSTDKFKEITDWLELTRAKSKKAK